MNINVRLQKLAIVLTRVMPVKLVDRLAALFGKFYMFMLKDRREYVLKNLYHIFAGQPLAREKYLYYMKRTFVNFALCMTDFFKLAYLSNEEITKTYEGYGVDNALKALVHKRGCILITLHIGNWDYAGASLAAIGYPMNALVEEIEPEMFKLYTHHRERTGMKCYAISRSGYAFVDTMKNNRILAVVADRDVARTGVPVKFFSGRRNIPQNLGMIIVKKRIPVVFGYMVLNQYNKKYRYYAVVEPHAFYDDVDKFNKKMVEKFEEYIMRYPDQWFVFHPEWIE